MIPGDLPTFWSFLTTPLAKSSRTQVWVWFGLSLAFAILCGGLVLSYAFRGEYLVDSDARQHVFWMQRFADPNLFPGDLITDYHQSVAPPGYATFYRLMNGMGISPFVLNKLMPPILGLIATGYCFGLCLELLPIPAAAFASTLLLNQALWVRYDLVSGTARSFVYPLVLAFLYYLSRRKLIPCLVMVALQGLFYPQVLFVLAGVLLLQPLVWQAGRIRWSRDRQDFLFCIAGLATAVLVMLPYGLQSSEFGPAASLTVAQTMPEFMPNGRTPFFHQNPWEFWLYGKRSGILPDPQDLPPLIWVGGLLPFLLVERFRVPLAVQLSDRLSLLLRVLLASLGMFWVAHRLLFKLHLPSRYTMHTIPIVLALSAGITLVLLVDALFHWAMRKQRRWLVAQGVAVIGAIVLLLYPATIGFPFAKYKRGEVPALYHFLTQQPKETLVASVAKEANNLPSFAQRSVLVSEMYAIPYQLGYYRQIRQRTEDLVRAQYSPDITKTQAFIRQYGIDFWLLDQAAFMPEYLLQNNWLMQYPSTREAIIQLQQGTLPALLPLAEKCPVLKTEGLILLSADCVLRGDR
jgi:hypothetical protein